MPRPEKAEDDEDDWSPRQDMDLGKKNMQFASWFEMQLSKFAGRLETQLVQVNGKLDDILRSTSCHGKQTTTFSYEEAESIRPGKPFTKEYVQSSSKENVQRPFKKPSRDLLKPITALLDGVPQDNVTKVDVGIEEICDEHVYPKKVLQSWEEMYLGLQHHNISAGDGEVHCYYLQRLMEDSQNAGIEVDAGFLSFLTFRPTSARRIFWELWGLGFVLYDIIALPFMLAFDLRDSSFTKNMDLVTIVYWIVDTISGFFVGFYAQDVLILKARRTALNYLKGSFALDISIVLLDLFLVFGSSHSTSLFGTARVVKLGKAAKIVRSVRSVRMLRLKKSSEVLEQVIAASGTELWFIVLKFARLLAMVLLVVHIIACLWWTIGCSDEHNGWVVENHMESKELGYKYATSLHWAITQFTPASMEVVPQNVYERFFAISIVLFGMVAFSSCISSITNYMMQLRNHGGPEREREKQLRTFLSSHKVSFGLTQQIWQFLRGQKSNRVLREHEDSIELLKLIPDVLRYELHGELYIPTLIDHPLFRELAIREAAAMQYLCGCAMINDTILTGREYFAKGALGEEMIFIHSGCMVYSLLQVQTDMENARRIGTAKYALARNVPGAVGAKGIWNRKLRGDRAHTVEVRHKNLPYCWYVEEGAWISEACLWISGWTHCGWLVSTRNVEVFLLCREKFHTYFSNHSAKSCMAICRYGAYFSSYAVKQGVWKEAGVTDLSLPFSQLDVMATSSFSKIHALEGVGKSRRHQGIGLRQVFDLFDVTRINSRSSHNSPHGSHGCHE